MQQLLVDEGMRRIELLNLHASRKIVHCSYLDEYEKQNENQNEFISDKIVDIAISYFENEYGLLLNKYEKKTIFRENQIGFNMGWHVDDCSIYKHKQTEENKHNERYNNIAINEKFSLFHKEILPKYTMIIYLTEYGKDFTGGEFCFVDQIVKPKKYDVILFDSREVHKVTELKSGTRKNILVKFYNVDKNSF